MKRKMSVLLTAILFLTGTIIAPVYCFASEFLVSEKIYSDSIVKSFSKNIIFTPSQKLDFGGFTKNIVSKTNENIDFSNNLALLSSNVQRTSFTSGSHLKDQSSAYKNNLAHFSISERLRGSPPGHESSMMFMLFLLLYIGLLRAVFVFSKKSNTNIFYIIKPLFAKTEVFHLGILK